LWFDWDWTGAESELKRAFDLNANSAEAHRGYGILLSSLRRFDGAVAHGERARQLDPLALITRANEGMFLYYAGRFEEAEERLRSTLELEPNFWVASLMLGKVHLQQKKHSAAIDVLTEARDYSGGSSQPLAMLGYIYALMQDNARARWLLKELESLAAKRYVPPYNFALIFHGLNHYAKVFEWLERAYEARDVLLSAFINSEPFWTPLRNDARFRNLLKRMNLSM
jgi:Flp pilus assembly protein TadD